MSMTTDINKKPVLRLVFEKTKAEKSNTRDYSSSLLPR